MRPRVRLLAASLAVAVTMAVGGPLEAETWRGLVVAEENRCSPYDRDDYRYSPSVEQRIIDEELDRDIYSPYTGDYFDDKGEAGIEHIIALSEAHDSGLCDSTPERKNYFSEDILNLTLASPSLNRHVKKDKDASNWVPDLNKCWFANRVVEVRLRYGLTIDVMEKNVLNAILVTCTKEELEIWFTPREANLDQTSATFAEGTP